MVCVYIYDYCYTVIKNEILPFTKSGSRGYNIKWNKSEKDKYFVIWGILKINQMNENNKQKSSNLF